MKPIRIEFVPPRKVLLVWSCAASIAFGAALSALYLIWKAESRSGELRTQREAIRRKIHESSLANANTATPKTPPPSLAIRLLQADLNEPLATIENMTEPGAELQAISIDNAAREVRLEYALDTLSRAPSVSAVLNAGTPGARWVLESVSAARGGQFKGGLQAGGGAAAARASWRLRAPGG